MKIKSLIIDNYKSFSNSGSVELSDSMNILVGRNNSGKSSILEAISSRFKPNPHKSLSQMPDSQTSRTSLVHYNLEVNKDELAKAMSRKSSVKVSLPVSAPSSSMAMNILNELMNNESFSISATRGVYMDGNEYKYSWHPQKEKSFFSQERLIYSYPSHVQMFDVRYSRADKKLLVIRSEVSEYFNEDSVTLCDNFFERVYHFKAERFITGRSPRGDSAILMPDASNLPEVLQNLMGSMGVNFDEYRTVVRSILPNIKDVTVVNLGNSDVQVLVTNHDPVNKRSDLYFSLENCGTGIGQILAIVYVVLSQPSNSVILIDEPNSFLHPSASRNLMNFLYSQPQHQYIVSTHSPEIISSLKPKRLLMAQWNEDTTSIMSIGTDTFKELNVLLSDIGAKLSDVFGADNICWVEGPTEEVSFNAIIESFQIDARGTKIVAMLHTGDFEKKKKSNGKDVDTILSLYNKVTGGNAIISPTLRFVFDNEGRDQKKLEDIKRSCREKAEFLPRMMYENYILHPAAIANVINSYEIEDLENIDAELITKAMETASNNAKLYKDGKTIKFLSKEWFENVHASNLLEEVFDIICGSKLVFDKPIHPNKITDEILRIDKNYLLDLASFIENVALRRS